MAPSLAAQFRALWHDLTSNDRHASLNSPYRDGSHLPLAQNRHSPLSSVSTAAIESHTDLAGGDLEAGNGFINSNGTAKRPSSVSTLQRQGSGFDGRMDGVATGEIQMQNFNEGLPPPPPVSHSWKRIDRWLEDNYEELFENMGQGATINDINELEHELDCTLPNEVRDSIQVHDGQERGGMPTGAIFGCMLLDCEEIIQEWQNWRTVNEVYFGETRSYEIPQAPLKAFAGSSSAVPVPNAQSANDPQWRQDLQDRQDSQPPGAIQKVYAHPSWIPLARDWGGNNICVDLSPGPTGKWGQVILMGRDYDCKYVISRSWATFLATIADDMGSEKPFIDEDTKELKLREFRQPGVEPAYIDILRWRSDQKYGRKAAPRKRPLRANSGHSSSSPGASGSHSPGRNNSSGNNFSPYASPTTAEDRGRSPHRLSNGKAPATNSPRAHHLSSPLARVAEEGPQMSASNQQKSSSLMVDTNVIDTSSTEKLISADTPRVPSKLDSLLDPVDTPVQRAVGGGNEGLGVVAEEQGGKDSSDGGVVGDGATGEMKDVQI